MKSYFYKSFSTSWGKFLNKTEFPQKLKESSFVITEYELSVELERSYFIIRDKKRASRYYK